MASRPLWGSGRGDRAGFDRAIETMRADIGAAGTHMALDGRARATYDRLIRALVVETQREVAAGRLTWAQGAERAHALRNDTLRLLRARSTPVGRAIAERLKAEGRTFNELVARKTVSLYGPSADFNALSAAQRDRVYAAIVESAGRSDPTVTRAMRHVSRVGRALMIVSVAVAVYNIAVAEDRAAAARREGAIMGAGVVGAAAGGALAGLACGPGAPVCVTVGAFVFGTAAALGVSLAF